jgi:hypothetical protein
MTSGAPSKGRKPEWDPDRKDVTHVLVEATVMTIIG